MMKKLLGAAVAVSLALAGTSALAGVTATKHDMDTMGLSGAVGVPTRGMCSYCHVPHGAQGDRLWAGTPAATYTPVANLCATCHLTGTGTITDAAITSTNMFQGGSHGFDETILAAGSRYGQGESLAASGLPYTGVGALNGTSGTDIDCTSCHDVHTDTAGVRPFLRVAIQGLCQDCHAQRENTGGIMSANSNGTAELGSQHPVGAAYVGNATRPITWTAPYQQPADYTGASLAASGNWTLGGHRSIDGATGGVICITCHIVHGTDPVNTANLPSNDLLVNVAASAAGDLCTDCHTGNPGATQTHPVASGGTPYTGSVTGNTLEIDATLLADDMTAPDGVYADAGALVCLSCHDTHFGMNNSPILADTGAVSSTYCQGCHTGTILTGRVHHPATGSTSYDTATYATIADTSATSFFDGNLTCETCHRAHNVVDQGITLNGSTADFLLRARNWDVAAPNTPLSTMCVACHTTNPAAYKYNIADTGLGSHWVSHANAITGTGAVPDLAAEDSTTLPGIQTNYAAADLTAPIRTTNWPATGLDYAGSGNTSTFSKVGGQTFDFAAGPADNAGGLLCESCHSVTNPREADWLLTGEFDAAGVRNAADNLTLYTATTETAQGGDGVCLGCHGIPQGTHPTTNVLVTKTGLVLTTTTSFASNPPVTVGTTEAYYPAADEMTCNSCHDLHAGNTGSGAYVLKDGQNASAMGAGTNLTQGVQGLDSGTPFNSNLDFTDLCGACHDQYR